MPTKKASPQRKPHHRLDEPFQAAETAYAGAMALFTQQNWPRAREAFKAFLAQYDGVREYTDVADRARTHLAACERKLAPPPPPPATPGEWMLEGVALANQGRTDAALAALDQALAAGAPAGRTLYARAAALALVNRNDEALEDLARAIEADPTVRFLSLADPDFERLRETAGYVALVEPPRQLSSAEYEEEMGEDLDDVDDEEVEDDFDEPADIDEEPPGEPQPPE